MRAKTALILFLAAACYLLVEMPSLAEVRAKNAAANYPGKRAVVVGGTSGIGHGVALRLARANISVTIVGRNAARGAEIVAELTALGGSNHAFISCDAQLLRNVRATVAQYAATAPSLDILVLTQGIATTQGRTETAEGLDQKLALHYFSRMAFILEFLPLLRASPSPRVLTVLSAGVHPPYAGYRTDFELKENYSLKNAADAATFYNDIAVDALSREPGNENILFVHAAPGFVNTNWGTEMPWYIRGLVRAIQPLGTSIQDCGEFMSEPLLRADAKGGFLLMGSKSQPVERTRLHDEARDVVWAQTKEVIARVMPSV